MCVRPSLRLPQLDLLIYTTARTVDSFLPSPFKLISVPLHSTQFSKTHALAYSRRSETNKPISMPSMKFTVKLCKLLQTLWLLWFISTMSVCEPGVLFFAYGRMSHTLTGTGSAHLSSAVGILSSWSCSCLEKSHSTAFLSSLMLLCLLTSFCSSFMWWHSFLTTAQLLQAVKPSGLTSVSCPRHSLPFEICRSELYFWGFVWVKPWMSQGQ